ncbi:hypothetical protein [Microbacterium sp. Marseille-Q6965]|uniref:hypothetical protein n=1 Tax=Microbacterium sp. Marseille-Q6965 TaxID=2965072 RepID=UPI0021B79919|nr:hypothetical protein [Microbacterium sp. Marseille-Q6965]
MSARVEAAARLTAPADELYPPVQYGGGWLLLAAAILLLIVLAVWLILFLTRPRRPRADATDTALPTAQALEELRAGYLRRIDEVERAYADGALSPRRANQELSGLTRAFVNEYTGIATPVMSLDELEAHGVHPALVDAVKRHYYPSLFGRGPVIDPHAGAGAAREVVNAWH